MHIKSSLPVHLRRRAGLTLLEAAMALGISALVVAALAMTMSQMSEDNRARAVADRLNEITDAATKYINANQSTLMANASSVIAVGRTTGTGAVPNPSLQQLGFLPANFVDSDSYGQNHQVVIKTVNSAGQPHLEALVVSYGGSAIPDRLLGIAARFSGAQAGFRLSKAIGAISPANVYGVSGGWQALPSDWAVGGAQAITAGHMTSLITTLDSTIAGNYLSRIDTGVPAANTMETNIYMAGSSIEQALAICADGGYQTPSCVAGSPASLTIGPNIAVPGNVVAGGNITGDNGTFNGNATIAGDVTVGSPGTGTLTVGKEVSAPAYCDGQNDCSHEVVPGGSSVLNDLQTTSLSLDTVVYSKTGSWVTGVGTGGAGTPLPITQKYTLGDLLPHYVAQYVYTATDGQTVIKPNCLDNGVPKIIILPVETSMGFTAMLSYDYAQTGDVFATNQSANGAVTVGAPSSYSGGPTQVITGIDSAATSSTWDHGTWISKKLSACDDAVNPGGACNACYSNDTSGACVPAYPNSWKVYISGTPDPVGGSFVSSALVMTYCYFN